jgi:hypothetical protein
MTMLPIEHLTPDQVQALSTLATEHGLCAPCACNQVRTPLTRHILRTCQCGSERSGLCDRCWPPVQEAIKMRLFDTVVCVDCNSTVFLSEESHE